MKAISEKLISEIIKPVVLFSLLILIMIFTCGVQGKETTGSEFAERMFSRLDSTLMNLDAYDRDNLKRFNSLKEKVGQGKSDEEKYILYGVLYNEYKTLSADSALKYIRLAQDLAEKNNKARWLAECKIRQSFVMAASGLLKEALEVVAGLSGSQLDRETRLEYYGQMVYLYSHLGNFSIKSNLSKSYYNKEKLYKDSIAAIITPQDKDYLWFMGWKYVGSDNKTEKEKLIRQLRSDLETSELDSRQEAMAAYMLSRLLSENGHNDEARAYMAAAAIADLRSSNRDIASLEELANEMFKQGDIIRAYNYLNAGIRASVQYPNRVRMAGQLQSFDEISRAYQQRLTKQEKRTRTFLIIVAILSVILLAVIVVLIKSVRTIRAKERSLNEANKKLNINMTELSKAHDEIESVNKALNELNERLKKSNEKLSEANYIKEEYLGYVFSLCSNYIKKHEDFRKSLQVKLKMKKYDEIAKMADTSGVAKEQLKEFYHSFDSIFLNIYPNFIEDFNTLLQPEEQIHPKEGELLNTELRIYALVRLGINDSVKIAEFLHCSPQTVYNNRFRVRNKSHIAKEDFVETVKVLGRFKP